MFSPVIGAIPRQFVSDRPIDASVGPQMKNRHRKVGMPTIRLRVSLSRRVRSE